MRGCAVQHHHVLIYPRSSGRNIFLPSFPFGCSWRSPMASYSSTAYRAWVTASGHHSTGRSGSLPKNAASPRGRFRSEGEDSWRKC